MKKIVALFLSLLFYYVGITQMNYLLVGTYDSPTSQGIYVYKFDSYTGSSIQIGHVKTSNASYLAVSPDQQFVYTVNENASKDGSGGGVTSFSFDKSTGALKEINRQSSMGNHPCYISVDKNNKWVIAGNYSSGNFSLLPVDKNGELGKARQVVQHEGKGPDTTRQESPHVHGVFLKKNNKDLYVTDLGTDKIMHYKLNTKKGKIIAAKTPFTSAEAGSGPRHLAFSPDEKYVYLLQELSGTVAVFADNGKGKLKLLQSISSLPASYKGPAGSADIHVSPDGNFLYASNRGNSNTIAIFSIDKETGLLTIVGHEPTLGETPRNFNFDPTGKFLLVANQNTNNITVFKRDIETGLLIYSNNMIEVDKPVCLKWIEGDK